MTHNYKKKFSLLSSVLITSLCDQFLLLLPAFVRTLSPMTFPQSRMVQVITLLTGPDSNPCLSHCRLLEMN